MKVDEKTISQKLVDALSVKANSAKALKQEKYLLNQFSFLGLSTPVRRANAKSVMKAALPALTPTLLQDAALELYSLPQREYHYCAIELTGAYINQVLKKSSLKSVQSKRGNINPPNKEQIASQLWATLEHMATTHSWWDSVDSLAPIYGTLLQYHPPLLELMTHYNNSPNMWLARISVLYQLHYKEKTSPEILFSHCANLAHKKEFFIQKAIGWSLRQYARVNPEAVRTFVKNTPLSSLSKSQALKHL